MPTSPVLSFADSGTPSTPLHIVTQEDLEHWLGSQPETVAGWLGRLGFSGAIGQGFLAPTSDGAIAVVGYGTRQQRARGRFHLAAGAARVPDGCYHIVSSLPQDELAAEALGWLLLGYSYHRFKPGKPRALGLKAPAGLDPDPVLAMARGEVLTRDLINTPANHMGPAELEAAMRAVAQDFGATVAATTGDALLAADLPLIHAVGRASDRAPRLIDLRWGGTGPRLTLVGKGVCFDTGGLNLKPASSMGLMKKDMGGAATVLGLAQMIMSLDMPVRLRVLVPAVENSVAGNAFRPQDVLASRKGLTVEVNNTDAEGRLVLADALALAVEEDPDILISMATLTGAARVAVGPDIAPFFTSDEALAAALAQAAAATADPVWRLPFHAPYESLIEPAVADLDNAPKGGMAGAITAALFLRRFAEGARSYTHFDIYGWQPTAAPARPVGGVGQGARALLRALSGVLNL
ncbi:leucyl aminopeptidase family protein [Tropicimonas sp.]|uniref:leucyl aminopeptidase family protein n=1 Tax=Tropicimonas sp. TaxID=2067044 RepID=UPI003A8AEF92